MAIHAEQRRTVSSGLVWCGVAWRLGWHDEQIVVSLARTLVSAYKICCRNAPKTGFGECVPPSYNPQETEPRKKATPSWGEECMKYGKLIRESKQCVAGPDVIDQEIKVLLAKGEEEVP